MKMLNVLKVAGLITVSIVGVLFFFGMLLKIIQRRTTENLASKFGPRIVILTGFIGTTVHETSHFLMAKLFGHKVGGIKLFSLDLKSETLGYVRHSYNKRNYYQRIGNFFIGVAPILIGTGIIIILLKFLVPDSWNNLMSSFNLNQYENITNSFSIKDFISFLVNMSWNIILSLFSIANMKSIKFWIFIICAISICMHMDLSIADFKGAFDGIIFIFIFSIVISLILSVLGINILEIFHYIMLYNTFIISFLIFGVVFSIIGWLFSVIVKVI